MKNQNKLTSSTGTLHRSRSQRRGHMWQWGCRSHFAKITVSMKEMTYLRYWSGRGRMSSASSMNACAPNAVSPLCHSGRAGAGERGWRLTGGKRHQAKRLATAELMIAIAGGASEARLAAAPLGCV